MAGSGRAVVPLVRNPKKVTAQSDQSDHPGRAKLGVSWSAGRGMFEYRAVGSPSRLDRDFAFPESDKQQVFGSDPGVDRPKRTVSGRSKHIGQRTQRFALLGELGTTEIPTSLSGMRWAQVIPPRPDASLTRLFPGG